MKKLLVLLVIFLLILPMVYAEEIGTAGINVPAITSENEGVMTSLEVEVTEGKGRVLMNAIPLTGIQTQNSERVATQLAAEMTGLNFSEYDVIFTFYTLANVIEGPSAGAAMAVATIAAAQNIAPREDAAITGMISADGTIGVVGGIVEKADATKNANMSYLVIPADGELQPVAVEVMEQPAPGWTIRRTQIEYINVTEYAAEVLGISVVKIDDIRDAVDFFLYQNLTVPELSTKTFEIGELPTIESPASLEPMKELAESEIAQSRRKIEVARELIGNSNLSEQDVRQLEVSLDLLIGEIEAAENSLGKGYFYASANDAFRVAVDAQFVYDYIVTTMDPSNKVKHVGDRIEAVTRRLESVQSELSDLDELVEDEGAFEWALASQLRLGKAEGKLTEGTNATNDILYSLAIAEAWISIAEQFHGVAASNRNGVTHDLSIFENLSFTKLQRLQAELGHFSTGSGFGAEWQYTFGRRLYEEGHFPAAYVAAEMGVNELETNVGFAARSKENIVEEIAEEIGKVDAGSSVWGTLYRDYATFLLHKAETEQGLNLLRTSLEYAEHAKLFSDVKRAFDETPVRRENDIMEYALFALIILLVLSGLYRLKRK